MKFNKMNRFGEPVWFNGIYKIVKYDYSSLRGAWGNPHYHCFLVVNQGKQWGDFVSRPDQYHKDLTFNECVKLCDQHAKTFQPTKRELENAIKSAAGYVNNLDKWGEPMEDAA